MTDQQLYDILRTTFGGVLPNEQAVLELTGYVASEREKAYNEGYDAGYVVGHAEGRLEGKEEGYKDGKRDGEIEEAYRAEQRIMEHTQKLDLNERRRLANVARGNY